MLKNKEKFKCKQHDSAVLYSPRHNSWVLKLTAPKFHAYFVSIVKVQICLNYWCLNKNYLAQNFKVIMSATDINWRLKVVMSTADQINLTLLLYCFGKTVCIWRDSDIQNNSLFFLSNVHNSFILDLFDYDNDDRAEVSCSLAFLILLEVFAIACFIMTALIWIHYPSACLCTGSGRQVSPFLLRWQSGAPCPPWKLFRIEFILQLFIKINLIY